MPSNAVCFSAPPEIVPFSIFTACALNGATELVQTNWRQLSEDKLWEEMCLCMLSSQTRFEQASTAVAHLKRQGLLSRLMRQPELVPLSEVESMLRPTRRRGKAIAPSIRFWRTRARNLLEAAKLLYGGQNAGLRALLSRLRDPENARSHLVATIPGFGMKQASHFLQNINYSRDFAIIDTRILRFLRDDLMVVDVESDGINRGIYVQLEQLIQRLASANGLEVRVLDRLVWSMGSR